ncbi:MAG TPA: L-histidine N(alpha)-methyltransferase [Candidatus Acidoferrales bacterium]|jgi:dimethylhistidine N-methyltransferase|nr:L-histidine N(alpha)-methyltransferase [Candidatus Acidoferrales bacterium]
MASAPRLATQVRAAEALTQFSSDVVVGLSQPGQKELPSKYLYDEVGSALFDVICVLPEYGLSRAGMRLLERHSADIVDRLPGPVMVAELGSGSGQKTRWLLEALARRQRVNYYPIDISSSALFRCQLELSHIDMVSIVGFERAYLDGLREVAARRREGDHLLVLFLGSTIGNFDRPAGDQFLREVRSTLREGDALLLATDLEKPISALTLAYDDSAGVTAAFDKNLLARINRELDGDFDLGKFDHVARYDESERRVEMHLRSKVWQRITIRKAGFRFYMREGETIWTESSHKYDPQEVIEMGKRAGYRDAGQWIDGEWPFAQTLFFAG